MSWFNSPPLDVTARKRHRCTWCGQLILPGEVYKRWVCIGEDGPLTTKMHPECEQAMQRYAERADGDYEYDPHSFTRGCTCEAGDAGHGTYPTCINFQIQPVKPIKPLDHTSVPPFYGLCRDCRHLNTCNTSLLPERGCANYERV